MQTLVINNLMSVLTKQGELDSLCLQNVETFLDPYKREEKEQLSFEQALELVRALVDKGEPLSKAAKDVAHQTGFKKGELYSRFLGQ